MKRKLIFFAFIIFALVLMLVACDGSGGVKVEITTSKSGKVDVTVYPSDSGSKVTFVWDGNPMVPAGHTVTVPIKSSTSFGTSGADLYKKI